ncbi:unnamed protein product [Lactuca saligna]|uniref:Uncharacterized protein n=1 Tax=Lactuca saligna TaxID=75948 RepID=A0AA35Y159_LACSI|nr:unnamed protein product [Lactuca saligna]
MLKQKKRKRKKLKSHLKAKSSYFLYGRYNEFRTKEWTYQFRSFVKVVNVPSTDNGTDQLLFLFYLKRMKPQYETWSGSKIIVVKVTGPIETESFSNAKFKVVRGSASQVHGFTLVDLPCLNPYEWIMLYNLLLRDEQKYEPVTAYLMLIIVLYIQEVGK